MRFTSEVPITSVVDDDVSKSLEERQTDLPPTRPIRFTSEVSMTSEVDDDVGKSLEERQTTSG